MDSAAGAVEFGLKEGRVPNVLSVAALCFPFPHILTLEEIAQRVVPWLGTSSILAQYPFALSLIIFFVQNLFIVHALMTLAYFGIAGLQWLLLYSGYSINKWFLAATKGYLTKIQPKKGYSKETQTSEIKWSLCTITVGSIMVTIVVVFYRLGISRLYWNVLDYGLPYYLFSLVLMFSFNDAWMYWTHRWLHNRWGFSHVHKIHHRYFAPTPFSTMAFHPLEAMTQFGPMLGATFVPLHLPSLYIFSFFLLFVSITEHVGYKIPFYERLAFLISTPMHHDLHHSVYRCNYAVYSTLWDRWMGTLVTEEDAEKDKATCKRLKEEQLGKKQK